MDQFASRGVGKKATIRQVGVLCHQVPGWSRRKTKPKLRCRRSSRGVLCFEATAILFDQGLMLAVALIVAALLMILWAGLELLWTLVLTAQYGHCCRILSVRVIIENGAQVWILLLWRELVLALNLRTLVLVGWPGETLRRLVLTVRWNPSYWRLLIRCVLELCCWHLEVSLRSLVLVT